jgi:hypothetical protein
LFEEGLMPDWMLAHGEFTRHVSTLHFVQGTFSQLDGSLQVIVLMAGIC